MTWQTRYVTQPVVVEDAPPSMIGTTWVKREVGDPDDPFREVKLVGLMDLGNDSGGVEAVVTSAVDFTPCFTVTADALVEAYTLKDEAAASIERLSDVLARAASL